MDIELAIGDQFAKAAAGVRNVVPAGKIDDMIGQRDKLDMRKAVDHWKAKKLDLTPVLFMPEVPAHVPIRRVISQDHGLDKALDNVLLERAKDALEQLPASGRVHRPETALASRPALGPRSGSFFGSFMPVRVLTTVVVSPPVRATPTTWVVVGSAQLRSTIIVASSPTPVTRWADSSCTRGLMQPAYQPTMVA